MTHYSILTEAVNIFNSFPLEHINDINKDIVCLNWIESEGSFYVYKGNHEREDARNDLVLITARILAAEYITENNKGKYLALKLLIDKI